MDADPSQHLPSAQGATAPLTPDRWRDHVTRQLHEYFPDEVFALGTEVRVERSQRRQLTRQYVIRIDIADRTRRVIIKHTNVHAPAPDRPIVGAPDDQARKHETEWRALTLLHRTVPAPELVAVRPLQHLPDEGVLIMEHLPSVTLRDVLLPRPLSSRQARGLDHHVALQRAGRLVRLHHDLSVPAQPSTRVQVDLSRHVEYIEDIEGANRMLDRVRAVTDDVHRVHADAVQGLQHGDLAPRNLLITPDLSVACIDMLARRSFPVAWDLAYMRASLDLLLSPLGRRSRLPGAPTSTEAYGHMLEGYEAQAPGRTAGALLRSEVDAHLVLVLVDRWAAITARGGLRGRRSTRVRWQRAALKRALDRALRDLAGE